MTDHLGSFVSSAGHDLGVAELSLLLLIEPASEPLILGETDLERASATKDEVIGE